MNVSAIILGGGLSSRMGKENKLFLPIDGKPMIGWVIENVLASKADEIILVGSGLSIGQLNKWESNRVKLVENKHYQTGMTSSIQAGVRASGLDGYMICMGDQPGIKTTTYNQIIASFNTGSTFDPDVITVPFFEGKKGNPVIFSGTYREAILIHQEPEGCRSIVKANFKNVCKVEVDDAKVLMDIDTKEDYDSL